MTDTLWDRYGFGPAFTAEWRRQQGSDLADLLEAEEGTVGHLWGDFALSSNLRGREIAVDLASRLTRGIPTLAGRKALDVGCGVGGAAVAMAELGAAATGIDLDPDHITLAAANARDHDVDVAFSQDDVLDPEGLERHGTFDAIVAEDVLEHVADAREATVALASLLTEGGVARVTIPNGDAVPFVQADGHYLLPGLTLLRDRSDAADYYEATFGWGEYDVGNYHSFDEYRSWFTSAGLSILAVEQVDPMDWEALGAELEAAEAAVGGAIAGDVLPRQVRNALAVGWTSYLGRIEQARQLSPAGGAIRFGARFWRFYLTKGRLRRRWSVRARQRWAWRAAVKQIPGASRLVRRLRR